MDHHNDSGEVRVWRAGEPVPVWGWGMPHLREECIDFGHLGYECLVPGRSYVGGSIGIDATPGERLTIETPVRMPDGRIVRVRGDMVVVVVPARGVAEWELTDAFTLLDDADTPAVVRARG